MSSRNSLPVQKRPLKAIRMMCIECMGGKSFHDCKDRIRECASTDCPLYTFRFGKNPNNKHKGNISALRIPVTV